jgi:hypothetical protein
MKRIRVHRHDRMTGGQQPIHDQAVGALDRHRQVGGKTVTSQPLKVAVKLCSLWLGAHRSTTLPRWSITVTSWPLLAQSHPTNIGCSCSSPAAARRWEVLLPEPHCSALCGACP